MPEENPTPGTTSWGRTPLQLRTPLTKQTTPIIVQEAPPDIPPRVPLPFPAFPQAQASPRVPSAPATWEHTEQENKPKLTDLSQQRARLCYAAGGCSNLGSIPGVRAAGRAPPDERRGPAAACSSRRGLRGSAGRAAAAPPAAQRPARLSFCLRRRPPPARLPSASTIGQPPPGTGHGAGAFGVTPRDPSTEESWRLSSAPRTAPPRRLHPLPHSTRLLGRHVRLSVCQSVGLQWPASWCGWGSRDAPSTPP